MNSKLFYYIPFMIISVLWTKNLDIFRFVSVPTESGFMPRDSCDSALESLNYDNGLHVNTVSIPASAYIVLEQLNATLILVGKRHTIYKTLKSWL
jgi:hypothetical protein